MKSQTSLNRLADLREQEVDRLTSEVASKERLRERYRRNLERLEQLCHSTGASGAWSPALSMNCGDYKQAVMTLAAAHREELALHDADMAVSQNALTAAFRQHEALSQFLVRQENRHQRAREAREQKRQDDMATQVWLRGQS
ncbi:MAG: flagellar export protein FliJ [Rhodocyclaceae bacterium]|nr:flagellar export protein FliJ [Rhodocyclaceae bacterium]